MNNLSRLGGQNYKRDIYGYFCSLFRNNLAGNKRVKRYFLFLSRIKFSQLRSILGLCGYFAVDPRSVEVLVEKKSNLALIYVYTVLILYIRLKIVRSKRLIRTAFTANSDNVYTKRIKFIKHPNKIQIKYKACKLTFSQRRENEYGKIYYIFN